MLLICRSHRTRKHIGEYRVASSMTLIRSLRNDPALRYPALSAILLLTITILSEGILRAEFSNISVGSELPAWLPQFGSTGQTVFYYILFFDLLKFVALPIALLWLAYAFGRHSATTPGH